MNNSKIFCFDIDNTICKTKSNFYNKSKPNKNAIKIVNKLFDNGHKIIFFTARGMGTFKENKKKIKKKYYNFTLKQLKKWNIKFHKLYIFKPSYDFIIDDKSIFYNKKWINNLQKFCKK